MAIITVANVNDGINMKSDPAVIADGAVADCIGFDVIAGGRLDTAGGLAATDLTNFLPSEQLQWVEIHYINSNRYVLATTADGLYANGTLIQADFTGRFKALSFLSNIYLVNGTYAKRFDGSACYQWGITRPTSTPTITVGTYLYKTIAAFESMTTWTSNQVNCTISAEGTIKKQGSYSMKVAVAADKTASSYVTSSLDLSSFTTGETSSDKDYIYFQLYIDNLNNLESLSLIFDGSDGTFLSDIFSYDIVMPTTSGTPQTMGLGKTADIYSEETVNYGDAGGTWDIVNGTFTPSKTVGNTISLWQFLLGSPVESEVSNQTLSYWKRNTLFQLKNATWQTIKVPKSLFNIAGNPDWSTIVAIKIIAVTPTDGAVNIYFDDMKMVGGSELIGDYWFMYTWVRNDADGNTIHESPPAIANNQFVVEGPVTFDREPLNYTSRPVSSDPQVNGGNIYALGGDLGDFWLIGSVADNTTTSGTIYTCEPERILNSKHNFAAPAGTDMVLFKNKIWMVGDSNYPRVLRTSDILQDGVLAPEGWPSRNGYELDGNSGDLVNIDLLNGALSIKGNFGEWRVDTTDATDFLQVSSKRVSDNGLLSQDSIVRLPSSHIYPSKRGFVETNGSNAQYIFPELETIIDSNIQESIGVNAGLVSYFTYFTANYGSRTAKIDLYNGKPRFTNINNILFDQLFFDPIADKVYGLFNNNFCVVDSGSSNVFTPETTLYAYLKSKTYRPGNKVAWSWISFRHNTGGIYYILNLYVDGIIIESFPFISEKITEEYFRFGPSAGYDFYFEITTDYNVPGQIIFPIRINHSGK